MDENIITINAENIVSIGFVLLVLYAITRIAVTFIGRNSANA